MIETININSKLYVKHIDNIKGFGVFTNQQIPELHGRQHIPVEAWATCAM